MRVLSHHPSSGLRLRLEQPLPRPLLLEGEHHHLRVHQRLES